MTAPAESTSPWRYFCEPGNAWTRNPTPAAWTGTEPGLVRLLEMTRPELRMYSAVHEAGHAVTAALHTDRLTPGAPSIGLHGVHITHPEWNGRLLRTPGRAHISWDTGTSFFDGGRR
ncbi:hypothetical protein PV726_45555 [Streptomyces europaeiscabiei]|uniref:hypothetical protein n=1 Tax=Streptomyces europaeiscabiei TaxID=146819 RepID=UPI0029B9E13B|nr:hypothetical protein [Streptomyces europaeiscabiei]MDX3697354.1 hypothetical protein [Streptomyces europaeiscabiei]